MSICSNLTPLTVKHSLQLAVHVSVPMPMMILDIGMYYGKILTMPVPLEAVDVQEQVLTPFNFNPQKADNLKFHANF